MEETIKRLHRSKLVPALISIVFGIALILARRSAMTVAVKITAGLLLAGGVGCVLMYLFGPVREPMMLGVGIMMALVAVLVWFNDDMVVDLFPILTGVGLACNGLSNMASLGVAGYYKGKWLVILFSLIMIVGGMLIAFHPKFVEDALMIYIGAGYAVNGVFDLILLHQVKDALLNITEKVKDRS